MVPVPVVNTEPVAVMNLPADVSQLPDTVTVELVISPPLADTINDAMVIGCPLALIVMVLIASEDDIVKDDVLDNTESNCIVIFPVPPFCIKAVMGQFMIPGLICAATVE